jgi:hemerythrin
MSLIEWDDTFNLRIKVMDEHHRHLIDLINSSYGAVRLNNKQRIDSILSELVDYSGYHFSTEELLMERYNFPAREAHEQEHISFSHQIAELQSKLNAGEGLYNIRIVVFLHEWLMNHILTTDRNLADYLVGNGVE